MKLLAMFTAPDAITKISFATLIHITLHFLSTALIQLRLASVEVQAAEEPAEVLRLV